MHRPTLEEEHYRQLSELLITALQRIERIEDTLAMPRFRAFFPKRLREQDPLEKRLRRVERVIDSVIDPLPED